MEDKNVCIFKGIQNIEKYITYLLDVEKHKDQTIFHNDVITKTQLLIDKAKDWKSKQESKKGHVPKPLSLVLSFPRGIKKEKVLSNALGKLHSWIKRISLIDNLGLNDDDIENIVREIPYVGHYKVSNHHIHFLIPKVLFSRTANTNVYINLYQYRYTNPLYQISGWNLKEKLLNEQLKSKTKSSTVYLKNELYDEIDNYRNLNSKLDKYIDLIEKDLSLGHTDKALKKITKIRKKNDR